MVLRAVFGRMGRGALGLQLRYGEVQGARSDGIHKAEHYI